MSSESITAYPSADLAEAPQPSLLESFQNLRRLKQSASVFAAACVMAVTAHTGHSEISDQSDVPPSPSIGSYVIAEQEQATHTPFIEPPEDTDRCRLTLAPDYIEANKLMSGPENPDIQIQKEKSYLKYTPGALPLHAKPFSAEGSISPVFSAEAKNSYTALTVAERAIRANAAKKHGLTLYDPLPYISALDRDLYGDPNDKDTLGLRGQLHINDYITAAREYLGKFGVTLKIKQPAETDPYIMAQQIDTSKTRKTIHELIQSFAEFPQEYVNLTGVKTVNLMYHDWLEVEGDKYAAGLAVLQEQAVYFNLFTGTTKDIARHEMLHHLDSRTCGGPGTINNDYSYTADNLGSEYIKDAPVLTYPDYLDKANALDQSFYNAKKQESFDEACKQQVALQQLVKNAKTEVTLNSTYHTTPAEDKAEIGKNLTTSYPDAAIFDSSTPVIRRKFTALIARIYRYSKALSKYFIDIKELRSTLGPSSSMTLHENCRAPIHPGMTHNNGEK